MRTCKFKYCFTILFFCAVFLLPGCPGNYGRIQKDAGINQSFVNAAVKPDYNYFYSGPEGIPSAILRIRKEYQLVSEIGRASCRERVCHRV